MKTVDAAEAQVRLDEILETAQRQPIVIPQQRRQRRDTAVVLSIAEYERLRTGIVRELIDLRNDVS
jgi:PHD/YefM family antitoxin component YafN of YafNO toxin-antitoxin module